MSKQDNLRVNLKEAGFQIELKPMKSLEKKPTELVVRVYGSLAEALLLVNAEQTREVKDRLAAGNYAPEARELARMYLENADKTLAADIETELFEIVRREGNRQREMEVTNAPRNQEFADKLNALGLAFTNELEEKSKLVGYPIVAINTQVEVVNQSTADKTR